MTERACHFAHETGVAAPGASVVITAGVPFGTPGSTNLLRIAWVRAP
jgi:pyruvate kinase